MKLLLDQNMSPRLSQTLSDLHPGSVHVQDLHLDRAPDEFLWETAQRENLVIVTRDSDFADKCLQAETPPKIVWIRVGNCTTNELEALLRDHVDALEALATNADVSVLVIR